MPRGAGGEFMGRNPERDARELAARKQKIVMTAFPIFAEKTIEKVSMQEIADACGMSLATLYRHYGTKAELVTAVSTWVWESYLERNAARRRAGTGSTAAEDFEFYLDSFIEMYHNRRDLLRFNQFFNVYVQNEAVSPEQMQPYTDMIHGLLTRFHEVYAKAERDGTLRTDIPEGEMFSTTLHLMLAVVTRYAVGLVYREGTDIDAELALQKQMLLSHYTAGSQGS